MWRAVNSVPRTARAAIISLTAIVMLLPSLPRTITRLPSAVNVYVVCTKRSTPAAPSNRHTKPSAELGIHKPVTIDRKTNLHEHRAYWCVRRAQDIFFSLLALIALSPLMLLTCIAVWIDSPGASPVFSQLRVGRNGKLFRLYKFRSMCPNAESKLNDLLQDNEMDGPVFKMKDDPRITRVGHFIRKTSIDELPQLVNILKGDMSIVGPRPALPREVAQYTPYEWQRLYVTPGLSCYWQIAPHRNQLSFEEWMALDVKYVKERSFLVDWKIIFATFRAVLFGHGE